MAEFSGLTGTEIAGQQVKRVQEGLMILCAIVR